MDLLTLIIHGFAGAVVAGLITAVVVKSKELRNARQVIGCERRLYEQLKIDTGVARFMVSGVLTEAVETGEANPTVWYHVMKRLHTIPELRRDLSLDEKYERMLEEYCSDKDETNAQ